MSYANKNISHSTEALLSAQSSPVNNSPLTKKPNPFKGSAEQQGVWWLRDLYLTPEQARSYRSYKVAAAVGTAIIATIGLANFAASSSGPRTAKIKAEASGVISTLPAVSKPTSPSTTTTTEKPTTTTTTVAPRPPAPTTTTTTTTLPAVSEAAPSAPLPPPMSVGTDVSYPHSNCISTIPEATKALVIVGINGGLDGTYNTCAGTEAGQFEKGSQYTPWPYFNTDNISTASLAGYQTGLTNCQSGDVVCESGNYGYSEGAQDAMAAFSMRLLGKYAFLDVETTNYWLPDQQANASDIQGQIDGIEGMSELLIKSPIFVGIYSTGYQWGVITGGVKDNLPAWLATGLGSLTASSSQAANDCSNVSFTGGPTMFVQYGFNGLDTDIACAQSAPK